jgi:hypothetical protein
MTIISVLQLLNEAQMELSAESQTFKDANLRRVEALMHAINAGEKFSQLRDLFLTAPNKGLVVTDIGTYKGWTDFLNQQQLSYKTVESYIFMYSYKQEYTEMKLISTDPVDLANGAAGHRKIASIQAVKWYLAKIAIEGDGIRGTLTACDYQKWKSEQAKVPKEVKYVTRDKYEELENKYNKLSLDYQLVLQELRELQSIAIS